MYKETQKQSEKVGSITTNEELVARIKAGINITENMLTLWEQNRRFIYVIALKYKEVAELDDLEQEGYLALHDAVKGYKSELGIPFINYAAMWIKQKMLRYIQNNGTVRIPVHESEEVRKYKKLVNAYCMHIGRKPTWDEISRDMHISYKMIMNLEKAANMSKILSLDSLLTADEDNITIGDRIASDVDLEADVLDDVQKEQLKAVIWPLVDALPENQGQVIRKRFQENKTVKEIGEDIGITPRRVRYIEDKAICGLYRSRNVSLLKSFWEDERPYDMGLTGTGVKKFKETWTSATERAAIELCQETLG